MKMAKMKKITISAFIPELASAHAYQDVRGSGGSLGVAIKSSVNDLLKHPHVKGRKLTSMKLTVAVVE
jgi:hypothetical protein